MDLQQYDDLIGTLYQGPLEDTPWQSFLSCIAESLNVDVISLVLRTPSEGDQGQILNYQRHNNSQAASLADPSDWEASAYRERFFAQDPFIDLPHDQVVSLDEFIDPSSLKESEYYQQYLKPAGIHHIIGVDVCEPGGTIAGIRLIRGQATDGFSNTERQVLDRLIPHFKRAIQLHVRLNHTTTERDLYAHTVDRLALGTILLDENAKLLKANRIAEALIADRDGLQVRKQILQVGNRDQAQEFQQLVDAVLERSRRQQPGMPEAFRASRPSGRADLGLVVRPVPQSQWSEGQSCPSVAVFISDPEQQSETSLQIVTRLFGFTPAEANLAMRLAQGQSMAEASEALSISQHTARAQLKSVFSKTGVSRQAELVRLIVKSVANLA